MRGLRRPEKPKTREQELHEAFMRGYRKGCGDKEELKRMMNQLKDYNLKPKRIVPLSGCTTPRGWGEYCGKPYLVEIEKLTGARICVDCCKAYNIKLPENLSTDQGVGSALRHMVMEDKPENKDIAEMLKEYLERDDGL